MAECDRFQEFRSGVPAATEDARRQAAARLRSAMEGKDRRGREPDSQSAGGPDGLCLPSPRLPQRLVPRSSSAPRGRTRLRSSSERRQPHTTRRDHPAPEVGVEVDLGGPGVHGHPRGPRSASIPHPTVPYPDAQTNRPTRMSTPKPSIRLRPADWAASSQPAARRATADGHSLHHGRVLASHRCHRRPGKHRGAAPGRDEVSAGREGLARPRLAWTNDVVSRPDRRLSPRPHNDASPSCEVSGAARPPDGQPGSVG